MTSLPEANLVHRLPPAPHFVGREEELSALRQLWASGFAGVVALVGLGGAGKTAVAARFLDELLAPQAEKRPQALLVWSFYQEPDAGMFLKEAHRYFAGAHAAADAKGIGVLHLLQEALSTGGPYLLVLDGLERVQRQESAEQEGFAQMEDPLLKGLLLRIANGMGRTMALITSRFPLADLQSALGYGYRHIDVGGLNTSAATSLLRQRGVQGDDAALQKLTDAYGAHALTLDHLGGLIGQFLGGDPKRAPEAPSLAQAGSDRQALRLARLLRAYQEHLPAVELTLLCRLCLLRRSVREEQMAALFLCRPEVHTRTIRELVEQIARLPNRDYPEEDVRDLAEAVRNILEESLCAAPVAGPEEIFRREVLTLAEQVFRAPESIIACEFGELARAYAGKVDEEPTDRFPLPQQDRARLRNWYERYVKLSEHPLFLGNKPDIGQIFGHMLSYPAAKKRAEDLSAEDVRRSHQKIQKRLRHFTWKHFALLRVIQLCRIYQQKWSLAGPLAHCDAADLRQVLDTLVGRHLVLREGDGSYSIHPAVRDYFASLASATEREEWHDILREQMLSLIQKPGLRLPEDPASLDLGEEAIYHALAAGSSTWALWLYKETLGGLRHLGWKLGEMARGLRILRQFEPCPDLWALAWFLRALGELESAHALNGLPAFRADIRLLQGRLPEVAAQGDAQRAAVAAFLMGETGKLPPDPLGCVVPREQLLLYLNRPPPSAAGASMAFYQDIGWGGDLARKQLFNAEFARQNGATERCRKWLEEAGRWILHSGSVEHLCLYHLMRARALRSSNEHLPGEQSLVEGIQLARQYGLGLYLVDLLTESAESLLAQGRAPAAEAAAREAMDQASAPRIRFRWGAALAGHLLGQALFDQEKRDPARDILKETLKLRQSIRDPQAWKTGKLLAQLG